MAQPLLSNNSLGKPINVASVPQRSPFRYPGGKTWLVPRVRQWLTNQNRVANFYEPFAGGGIISLTVAFENLSDHVTMVELDDQVAAVWHTIIDDEHGAEWLSKTILEFDVTEETVQGVINVKQVGIRQKAFQTILKNRTYRGGILAKGSAPLKKGENGRGIKSRWYPETLAKRIGEIAKVRRKITFIEGDGMDLLETHGKEKSAAWFIDPPYTASKKKAGSRLYTYYNLDHHHLFDLAANIAGDFLMTYDNGEEIWNLAKDYCFAIQQVAMNNTHHAEMTELLIGRSLDWLW
jgi:DNA adenine methylase